ncbi:uncharacterized protein SAPINGB_P003772 [Magnusiomyces paraingens]|uniref:DUF7732 domain-containing protein n=1 Tax=Magnusiomyces paraingens TaxID=2606893 RepID=A0A5E8BRX0_9ASCO|nr:uncharacterized protein SAPINGB_P003772 [Saprochaete ingens]VVT53831.1 unnamed protein product [Saprochaete ingens]
MKISTTFLTPFLFTSSLVSGRTLSDLLIPKFNPRNANPAILPRNLPANTHFVPLDDLPFLEEKLVNFKFSSVNGKPVMIIKDDDPDLSFEKRRGGSSGGKSGSSSSGSSSSSSSGSGKTGSSSSSSSGSTSSSSRGSSTSSSRLSSGLYSGGAVTPFAAGAVTGLGLGAVFLLAGAASSAYPGYWGHYGTYEYSYNTTINGTDYVVRCFCMQYNPCSCEKTENQTYFDNLPTNISKTTIDSNGTHFVVINGTLTNQTQATATSSSSASASSASASASAAATTSSTSFANILGSPNTLFTIAIAAGSLFL